MLFDLPGSGDQRVGIRLVDIESRAAGVTVDEEYALPVCAGIGRLEHATLFLRTREAPLSADVDDVGVGGMNEHARDSTGLAKPRVLPGFPGIERLVDAVAHDI